MKIHLAHLTSALLLGLSFAASGCDPQEHEQPVVQKTPAATAPQPTAERLLERSRDRWARIQKGGTDLVSAYDFAAAEQKRMLKLSDFLTNMENHRYENMRVREVVALQNDMGFLRVDGLWTPIGPKVAAVKLEPGQTLTQSINMIEAWRWTGEEWYFVKPYRDNEFFEEHPDLLKAAPANDAPKAPASDAPGK